MWAATRGLQLFIMKGIHHSVPALPLSTQFSHTGPPSLPLVPSRVSVPRFSPFHVSFSIQSGAKEDAVRGRDRGRDKKRVEGSRSAGQLGDQRGGRACHFSFHPSRRLAGVYVHESAYCTWASAELHWVGAGRVGEHHRPQHLFSSQAICSASPGLPVGLRRTHTCTHIHTTRPPTH